jgi:hypothetical protein
MKFLDNYFMNCIDDALDRAVPLDVLTSWYVKRNPKVWEYYMTMLELEIELCFPDSELADNVIIQDDNQIYSRNRYSNENLQRQERRTRHRWRLSQKIFCGVAVVCVVLATFMFIDFMQPQIYNPPINLQISITIPQPTKEKKIDISDFFSESLFSVETFMNWVPVDWGSKNTIEDFVLEILTEPIVNFADNPSKTTLTFLTTTAIAQPPEQSPKNKNN